MARVIWRKQAIDDLNEISAYIEESDPIAAKKMSARLQELGESLTNAPDRGRPTANGTRELVTVKPYILRYRVTGDVVQIVRIRHSSRRPLK